MPMKTIHEDIDDLDRMVDTDAPKHAVRSQIRLIAREGAALEADYSRLAEAHAQLDKAHSKLQKQHAKLKQPKHSPPKKKSGPGFVMGWKR